MPMNRVFALWMVFWIGGCAPIKPAPSPESAPMSEIIARESSDPRRAASLRMVDAARTDLEAGRLERAAEKLARGLEVDPGNPYAYFYLGVVRFRANRLEEAAELFIRSAGLFADAADWRAEALAYRGESFERSGKIPEARGAFEEALKADSVNQRAREGASRLAGKMW
ncbi:MAG: tetratricopeptide repeat protein [Pseudomonadota bacterium]